MCYRSKVYAFRLRSFNNTSEIKQLVIFAHVEFLRSFRGVQLASAGYYLSRRAIKVFEPLRPLYQTTHLLKITALLLINKLLVHVWSFVKLDVLFQVRFHPAEAKQSRDFAYQDEGA